MSSESGRAPSDIVFTHCTATNEAHATAPGGARRQISIDGKRIRTIDVHAHCLFAEALAVLGEANFETQRPGMLGKIPERLREMDRQGVDMQAISINPFWYRADRDRAAEVVRINNEKLAELCAAHPDRFVAFASVALQYPDLAVQQLEHAVKKLGLRGAAVGAEVASEEFSNPRFHPFWAKCEEMGVLVFIHPQGTPELAGRLKGNGWLANVIGNPLATTIALSHLIFEGTLDRFPGLKICAAHGGGFLPSYAPRSDHGCRITPPMCDASIQLRRKPTEYLRDMYFDALVFTSEGLRHLAAEVGTSQIVIGTDHPIPWEQNPVDHIMNTPGFSNAERAMMLGETAARLLRIE